MATRQSTEQLLQRIEELENRLAESEQLIEAIKAGEVDAFAVNTNDASEIYTLQSGDYAYRVLIEKFGEGAVNLTEDGLIVYTNTYFYELLRLPYEKVVGTSFKDFVHRESLETFDALLQRSLNGSAKGEINLKVGNKIIPAYVSLTSLQPRLATVGMIVTDLTDKKQSDRYIESAALNLKRANQQLESKNHELEQSNTELASFSYVASHDLQEPLRKIQTFSNRILEKEKEKFSEKTLDYFQRITAAALRMQTLIEALLNYSRTDTADVVFKQTDLNALVDDVKQNLRDVIEEKSAVIEYANLPTLKVVPHQFNQLFTNLVSNAIKYSKPNTKPVIKITAEVVPVDEMQLEDAYAHDSYWKISIADNGIGFEPQYEHRIFELFQRLHSKAEYQGTGIGLAICKKIMQNHRGFIKATGVPDVGATFHLYLPVTKG